MRVDEWQGHTDHDEALTTELIQWADLVIAEWCLANAKHYADHRRPDQALIVRFHRTELNSPWPPQLDLDRVHRVVFVGPHIQEAAIGAFDWPSSKSTVIPNFVNTVSFDRPKTGAERKTLGLLGFVPRLKRIDRALDILRGLRLEGCSVCR